MKVEVSQLIDRPVADVFRWFVDEHVRNHPRWDPHIELWLDSAAPIGVGTIIRRRNSRSGTPVDGIMEVVDYEPGRSFATVTHDGPVEIRGRATFDAVASDRTNLTVAADVPESIDATLIRAGMERSLANVKRLIEAEL
jgi:hypothetical protein